MAERIGQINEATFVIKEDFVNLGVFGKAALEAVNAAQMMIAENIDKTTVDQLDVIRHVCIRSTGEVAFHIVENDLKGWGEDGFPPTSIVRNECRRAADCFIKHKEEALEFLKTYRFQTNADKILCVHWYIMHRDKDEAIRRFGKKTFGRIDCPYDPFLTERLNELASYPDKMSEYMSLLL